MIPAIVLAAGQSTRMGQPKANLPIRDGEIFLSRIVSTLLEAGIADVVVVVGHEAESVMREFARRGLPARFVENDAYVTGQLSSILAGLSVVDRPGVTATLLTLVDVPFFRAATARALVDRYRRTHAPVVRPTRGVEHGHPLLVDRTVFDEIRKADPQTGAKSVVRAHARPDGDLVIDDDPGAFTDIDTPAEYQLALREFAGFPEV